MSNFVNKLFCEDCRVTMKNMICENFKVDAIITSPPYNTVRDCVLMKKVENKIDTIFMKISNIKN